MSGGRVQTRDIVKVLMSGWNKYIVEMRRRLSLGSRGDTLIEVTLALAILGFVLLGSTAIGAAAFRTGQTARERTQVSEAAQGQLEALRSFRDNHSWTEFRSGNGCGGATGYCGIDQVLDTPCIYDSTKRCFHMELVTTGGGTTEWVPKKGALTYTSPGTPLKVPTAVLEIAAQTSATSQCGYDFLLHYQFEPLGGGVMATNQITTRLVNLKYQPGGAGPVCP